MTAKQAVRKPHGGAATATKPTATQTTDQATSQMTDQAAGQMTDQTTKISPVARDRVERRDEVRLPAAWIDTCAAPAPLRAGAPWLVPAAEAAALPAPAGPVLALLGSADTDEAAGALAAVVASAEAGERVYVLAARGWDPGRASPRLCACARVLMRRVPDVPGCGVVTAGAAWLWLGDHEASRLWRLQLDGEQAEALRQIFLSLLWHHAIDEAWTGAGPPVFRKASARPFDVPEPSRTAAARTVDASASADPLADLAAKLAPARAMLHRLGGAPPAGPLRRLWLPPSGQHHEQLAGLIRGGAEVRWADRKLPELATDGRRGAIRSPGPGPRLWIELNGEQAKAAAALLEQPGAWRFETDVRLGDHAAGATRLWPGGAAAARPVEVEQIIELGSVAAEHLREMRGQAPASWPAPATLALAARYRWTVAPPRLPAGAEEDGLVKRWRQVDQEWASRLDKVRAALERAEAERGRLRQAFSRLVGALLGFDRTGKELSDEHAALATMRPSAEGPERAREVLDRLAALEAKAGSLGSALEAAEHGAKLDEAREQQEKAWRQRVEDARQSLPERLGDLDRARERGDAQAAELKRVDDALPAADERARKDLKAQRRKLSDEIEKITQTIQRLEQEIAGLEQQKAALFDFKPPAPPMPRPATRGAAFVPTASQPAAAASQIPEEALPAVGELRRRKGERYLVIADWAELARGEQEAARLAARLVAPEDA